MKNKPLALKNLALVLTLAIVSASAGVVVYQVGPALNPGSVAGNFATQPSTAPDSTSPSPPGDGFSFNSHDEQRTLPDLRFMGGDGSELTLADFQGKLVLLNIWATWCGPCRQEMSTLDNLQTKLGGNDFVVLALSIDTEIKMVRAFYAELGLTSLRIYIDESVRAPVDLNVRGIPATLLIDPQGREIGRVLGPADWDSAEVVAAISAYLDAPMSA